MKSGRIGGALGAVLLLASAIGRARDAQGGRDAGVPSSPLTAPSFAAAVEASLGEASHAAGVQLLRKNELEAAVERLRLAVELEPTSALYVTDLGYAYLKQERLIDAEQAFKKAITLDPQRYHAYEHLEQSVMLQPGRWEKRRELLAILERGLEVSKARDTRNRIELARIRAERGFGHVERARGHLAALRGQALPRTLEKQVEELEESFARDRRAQALRDWPEPEIEPADRQRLATSKATSSTLTELIARYPAWRAPRWFRAQHLTGQGHYDEAVKELTVLVRLAPSVPDYHRLLGTLLAEHGGLLELDRADEELRAALALEPEWSELAGLMERLAIRRGDSSHALDPISPPTVPLSDNAVVLFEEAEATLEADPGNTEAVILQLEEVLREAPGYVDAAALLYTLTQRVFEPTVQAAWDDGALVFALYREFTQLEPALPAAMTDRWLDRAVALGHGDARFSRALKKMSRGDLDGAELELSQYLALATSREDVEAAMKLRGELRTQRPDASVEATLLLNARLLLQRGDSAGALRELQAPCRAGLNPRRLLAIGVAYEGRAQHRDALDCYELGFAGSGSQPAEPTKALQRRAARLLARADPALFQHPSAQHLAQLMEIEPAAIWALSRRALVAGRDDEAQQLASRYLAQAGPDGRFAPQARELEQRLTQSAHLRVEEERRRRRDFMAVGVVTLLLLTLTGYLVLFRGVTVARAVRRRSRLFPELSRVIGELRHDVFKHRTSALGLVGEGHTTLEKIRATLLEPTPTSQIVVDAYARLVTSAQAQGVRLRRLAREPVFGPLVRDLRLAEEIVTQAGSVSAVQRVDERLRTVHLERLEELLARGPRARLDAVEIQRWIASVEAEHTGGGKAWAPPALLMSDPVLAFPLDRSALYQIFSNLLRNAQAAVGGLTCPKIQVSLARTTDFTGQSLVRLQVSDNAETDLTSESVEAQDPRRGLGIVRETTRDWNGRLVVYKESGTYRKAVGVQFGS